MMHHILNKNPNLPIVSTNINSSRNYIKVWSLTAFEYYTKWFKYDRDKLWLLYTQIVLVIFEPPCTWTWHCFI
jgi:hypothetical protein